MGRLAKVGGTGSRFQGRGGGRNAPIDASPDCVLDLLRREGVDRFVPDEVECGGAVEKAVLVGVKRRVQGGIVGGGGERQCRFVLEWDQV